MVELLEKYAVDKWCLTVVADHTGMGKDRLGGRIIPVVKELLTGKEDGPPQNLGSA